MRRLGRFDWRCAVIAGAFVLLVAVLAQFPADAP